MCLLPIQYPWAEYKNKICKTSKYIDANSKILQKFRFSCGEVFLSYTRTKENISSDIIYSSWKTENYI